MSNAMTQMSGKPAAVSSQAAPARAKSRTWWVVFLRELQELWVGGRALVLLLAFSLILGVETYVFASSSELSLMPPKEMVYETLKVAISVSLFICLIIGADSLSGERERATLEAVLLSPASRRQIVVGKFLAAITVWPASLAITIPYMYVLAQGDEVFGQAVLWGALLGTILAPAFAALGMFVSYWCNSNKTSFFISIGVYLLFLLPVQLPGRAQTGAAGQFLQWINPIAGEYHFLSKILVNNRTFAEWWTWLIPPVMFALVSYILIFLWAAPNLGLEGGRASRPRVKKSSVAAALVVGAVTLSLLQPTSVFAQAEATAAGDAPLQIGIDTDYKVVKTGDSIFFDTVVSNDHNEASPPIIVAMNIINLDKEGDVVDPEDWSPERTQYIEQLAPGESGKLSWRVNAILDGDYIVYMVAMPEPASQGTTSQAVASSGIHLTVTPYTRLNPGGVLPYTFGVPLIVGACLLVVYKRRRKEIDRGETK